MARTTVGASGWGPLLNADLDGIEALALNGLPLPKFMSGGYHMNAAIGGAFNNVWAPTVGTLYALPFYVFRSSTFDAWSTTIGAVGAAGSLMRCGVYNVDLTTGQPSTLVVDAGTIDCTSTGDKLLTINTTLAVGVYFVVAVTNDAAIRHRAIGSGPQPNPLNSWFNKSTGPIEVAPRYRTFTGYTTAALPATATVAGAATVAGGDVPGFYLRGA